jgi:aminopeptidase
VLVASKPLVLNGNIIDGIRMVFERGRIASLHADVGEDTLRASVEIDEGSHYLGEIALVPYDSPISNSGVLFFNTLFDENASCHFAFGEAYPSCIQGGNDMTVEELAASGINAESSTHVDFMVGTSDLSIVGTTHDGQQVAVFESGNFAF